MRDTSSRIVLIEDRQYEGKRIDSVLSEILEIPRNQIQHHIGEGFIRINGKPVKKNYRLKLFDEIVIELPPPKETLIEPVDAPVKILYVDDSIVVVDKPAGIVVHPGAASERISVLSALKFCKISLSGIGEPLRGGVVHRIDKDTSGVIVLARTPKAHFMLAKQFFSHTIERKYIGIVHGHLKEREGVIEAPIGRHPVKRKEFAVVKGGKSAVTFYRVLRRLDSCDLVMFRLHTGRTHQIRVHMKHIGHPLVGDRMYSSVRQSPMERQALHAFYLGFEHPCTGKFMRFYSRLPEDMRKLIETGG